MDRRVGGNTTYVNDHVKLREHVGVVSDAAGGPEHELTLRLHTISVRALMLA
jgi:hypothetical protein